MDAISVAGGDCGQHSLMRGETESFFQGCPKNLVSPNRKSHCINAAAPDMFRSFFPVEAVGTAGIFKWFLLSLSHHFYTIFTP
jgi:hypothetical protein